MTLDPTDREGTHAPERGVADVEQLLVTFLRAFEAAQESILLHDVSGAQAALRDAAGDVLPRAQAALAQEAGGETAAVLEDAVEILRGAFGMFCLNRPWPEYATAYLASRAQQVRALERLYAARGALPGIEAYFRLEGSGVAATETAGGAHAVGIVHHDRPSSPGQYSLYVPEDYDPDRRWPLIVALHGSHGRGEEYLWTWLRAARGRGAIVLAPKSVGLTWSIMQPAIDADAILAMLGRTFDEYAIDPGRVLLTGLSDGATFAYLLGLEHADRFSACAPIAGVLAPSAERLLRANAGADLPLHVVHGALDPIFPVASARRATALLESRGYPVTYTELPQWGHALTTRINETVLMPWFESLGDPAAEA